MSYSPRLESKTVTLGLLATLWRVLFRGARLKGRKVIVVGAKPARNMVCPCGSGIKFKKCCARTR